MAFFVALLGKGHATSLARKRPIVDVHTGVVHNIAKLGELGRANTALEDLIHPTSLLVELVRLEEHVLHVRVFLDSTLFSLHLGLDELHEFFPDARVDDSGSSRHLGVDWLSCLHCHNDDRRIWNFYEVHVRSGLLSQEHGAVGACC